MQITASDFTNDYLQIVDKFPSPAWLLYSPACVVVLFQLVKYCMSK